MRLRSPRKSDPEGEAVQMQKKIPERRCVGCNESKPKRELIRVVRAPDGTISADATGRKSGRGVYICPKEECLNKAIKTKRMEKSLMCPIPEEIYSSLAESVKEASENMTEEE